MDFITITTEIEELLRRIEASVKNVGGYFQIEYEVEKYKDMIEYNIKIQGPLYIASGHESAKQRIKLAINTYERASKKPETIFRTPMYETLRPYNVVVESISELLADKVKATIERREKHKTVFVRDLYDIWIVTKKYNLNFDFKLVKEKMKYGIKPFSLKDFKNCISESEEFWREEMSNVMRSFPEYGEVKGDLLKKIKNT